MLLLIKADKTTLNELTLNELNKDNDSIFQTVNFNAGIGTSGNLVALNNWNVKIARVTPLSKFKIISTLTGTGSTAKASYGFYSDLPISSSTYISGSTPITGSISLNEEITVPENAYILAFTVLYNKAENNIIPVNTKLNPFSNFTKQKKNISMPVLCDKHQRIRNGGYDPITNVINNGIYYADGVSGYSDAQSEDFIGEVTTVTKTNFDLNTDILNINLGFDNTKCGFWLNTADLNGNSIRILGVTVTVAQLKLENFSKTSFITFQVLKVFGDWTYVQFSRSGVSSASIMIAFMGVNVMNQFRFANFTIIESSNVTLSLNPFHINESIFKSNRSNIYGKNILYTGDSQLSYHQVENIRQVTGSVVKFNQEGGRAMTYRAGKGQFDNEWLYHWDRRKLIKGMNPEIFVMNVSTNDYAGGGTLTEASIQAVINNYPTINDVEPAITNKLALFNALSDAEKESIFNFKSTYAAYVRQIIEWNQNARFLFCTIPFSRPVDTSYEAIRANFSVYNSIKSDIEELGRFFNCRVLDLFNMVNLTAENAVTMIPDRTHWISTINKRIGSIIASELINNFNVQ
jgi:hypothetical protein